MTGAVFETAISPGSPATFSNGLGESSRETLEETGNSSKPSGIDREILNSSSAMTPEGHCQVNGTKPRFSPKRQESCNLSTEARHLSPIGKSPGSEESMMNGLKMITIDSKQVLNGTVN